MPSHRDSLASRLAREARRAADELAPPLTDSDRLRAYRDDPVGFARDVLRIDPWSRQEEILRSILQSKRVAVVSGHKTGKSTALAILALWFYCVHPSARVVVMAATERQVKGIIWREIRRLVRVAREQGVPIPGSDRIALSPAAGLTDPSDLSEIRGYTAKEAEGAAGTSGGWILYLVDEATGVGETIFEAIEGNRAGGNAWIYLISNPTRAEGTFYEAFHSRNRSAVGERGYLALHVDSRESPNVTGEWRTLQEWDPAIGAWAPRTTPIPGLADPGWVEEKRDDWGEESAMFKVRVAGLFVVAEAAKVFPLALIGEMVQRWHEQDERAHLASRLYIGVDPAGDGDGGDESVFCARRGARVLELIGRPGMAPAAHVEGVRDMIAAHRGRRNELPPIVSVESEGDTGWRAYVALKEHAERTGEFEVSRVLTSQKAVRQPLIFDRIRDEMWASAREWARSGGAIPEHSKLERDLHAPEYSTNLKGKQKLTKKRDLRRLLGRSPDYGDAFVLSVWEPLKARMQESAPRMRIEEHQEGPADVEDLQSSGSTAGGVSFNPYAGNPFSPF